MLIDCAEKHVSTVYDHLFCSQSDKSAVQQVFRRILFNYPAVDLQMTKILLIWQFIYIFIQVYRFLKWIGMRKILKCRTSTKICNNGIFYARVILKIDQNNHNFVRPVLKINHIIGSLNSHSSRYWSWKTYHIRHLISDLQPKKEIATGRNSGKYGENVTKRVLKKKNAYMCLINEKCCYLFNLMGL